MFDILCKQFIWQLGESHHIAVWFCNYIICCLRLEPVLDSPMVRRYRALHLMIMPITFQSNACVERGSIGALKEEIERPNGSSLSYLIRIPCQLESRQGAKYRYSAEWIKYLGPHLPLQTLCTFKKAWSEVTIIMTRLICMTVCSVFECLLEAVVWGPITRNSLSRLLLHFSWTSTDKSVSVPGSRALQYQIDRVCSDCSPCLESGFERVSYFFPRIRWGCMFFTSIFLSHCCDKLTGV